MGGEGAAPPGRGNGRRPFLWCVIPSELRERGILGAPHIRHAETQDATRGNEKDEGEADLPCVYRRKHHGAIYTGVTSDLSRRVEEHKSKVVKGFSSRHGTYRLIYYEEFDDVYEAIEREKQIKSWRRRKKLDLIRAINPEFRDLLEGRNERMGRCLVGVFAAEA